MLEEDLREESVPQRFSATVEFRSLVILLLTIASLFPAENAEAQILSDKRGFADAGASYNYLQSTNASWYYTWGTGLQSPGNHDALHIPQFRWWHNLQSHLDWAKNRPEPTEWVFVFNEPERGSGQNGPGDDKTVAQAISDWKFIQNGLAGSGIKMVTPSVSDDGPGQAWINSFHAAAQADPTIQVDAVGFHWYGWSTPDNIQGAISNFKSRVNHYHNMWNKPVFINEFAIHDWGGGYSNEQMRDANAQFLADVVPWMESNPDVAGYAPYNWFGSSTLIEGNPLTPTNVGLEFVGAIRNGATYDASIQDLGENVVYLANGNITKTSGSGVVRYINALEGTNTITGTVDWGLNDDTDWVRIQPGARLQKTGTNTLTLSSTNVTNNGTAEVSAGKLRLEEGATVSGAGNWLVKFGGTLNVTGDPRDDFAVVNFPIVLQGGKLETDTASGMFLENGATISGAGTVFGSLIPNSGTTIQVGGNGLPSQLPNGHVLLDNFNSYDNSTQTLTTDATVGVWQAEFVGTNNSHVVDVDPGHGQALQTKGGAAWRGAKRDLTGTDAAVEVGETQTYFWQVKAFDNTGNYVEPGGNFYDFMMGLSPSTSNIDSTNAWQDFAVMPFIDNGPAEPFLVAAAPTTPHWAAMSADQWHNVWLVIDNDAVDPTFDLYYSPESDPNNPVLVISDANWRNFAPGQDLNAIGFMAAGVEGSEYLIDNIFYAEGATTVNPLTLVPTPVGEVLNVDGDLLMLDGATLALDLHSPAIHDLLAIQGTLTAAGTLQLNLDPNAPALSTGDTFDILDFAEATGEFDLLLLPVLSTGLTWNVTDLLTTGELSVVTDVDLDNDGSVTGLDFLEAQRNAPTLLSDWKSLYGSQVSTGANPIAAVVPEPTAFVLFLCAIPLFSRERDLTR